MTTAERTHQWRYAFAFFLVMSAGGVYTERPFVLTAAIIGVAYAAYPLLIPKPTVDLALSRTVNDATPTHGDSVTVSVTVTNTGPRTVTDLRLIDGVPSLLTVTSGTARHTATLVPGGSTTFQYTLTAKHGAHRFKPATAIVHDISGGWRVQTNVPAGGDTTVEAIDCAVDIHSIDGRRAKQEVGPMTAKQSGAGIEFYQTRAYQRGDPANRIDWRRFARTRKLTTVEFREERSSPIVLCLDARPQAVRNPRPTEPHAVAYSVGAATELLSLFCNQGRRVGVAVFGTEFAWLAPATGRDHHDRAIQLLRTQQSLPTGTDGRETADRSAQQRALLRRSSATDRTILFSPLLDAFGVTVAQQLNSSGRTVTVISPDSSTKDTLGGELVRVERQNRVQFLQKSQIPVCDWTPGEPISVAIPQPETGVK